VLKPRHSLRDQFSSREAPRILATPLTVGRSQFKKSTRMNIVLRQSRVSKLSAGPGAVQLRRVSRWHEAMLVATGLTLNRPSLRSYAYLAIELSRGTVLLGQLSRHGLVIVLVLTCFGIALAQTMHRGAA
jgi:hypothetical protein